MITIEIDDQRVLDVLRELAARADDLTPALQDIGEYLVVSTKQRFAQGVAPDGTRWPANSEATLLHYLKPFGGGGVGAKGAKRLASKKPLIGETRRLSTEIHYQLIDGGRGLEVGSPMKYAAMQHFGGTKAQWPHLWGDIPARPFLGLSDDDRREVLDILSDYLRKAAT